jgi:hypothetical protein
LIGRTSASKINSISLLVLTGKDTVLLESTQVTSPKLNILASELDLFKFKYQYQYWLIAHKLL